MKNIAELIMAKDDEDEGEPAIRRSLLSRNGWKDCLMLWMIPVKFCDELEKLSKLEAQHIDVCTYIGFCRDYPIVNRVGKILYEENIEDDLLERTYRLHFPPQHFPPPRNLNDGGNSIEFAKVRTHIKEVSCVFCNGGKNERLFTCD